MEGESRGQKNDDRNQEITGLQHPAKTGVRRSVREETRNDIVDSLKV